MFVSESNIFNPASLKVRLTTMEGVDLIMELTPDMTVDKLKIRALGLLYTPAESMKSSLYHKLVLVRTGRCLPDDSTAHQEGVLENDEMLLLRKRPLSPFEAVVKKEDGRLGPDSAGIREVTKDLESKNLDRDPNKASSMLDFQVELRKILISLIEAAQRILCLNPKAAKIFKEAQELMAEQASSSPKIDESSLKQLMDMGFSETRAKKALILNKMSTVEAMEWLFMHESDEDIDVPLPEMVEIKEEGEEDEEAEGASAAPSGSSGKNSSILEPQKVSNILESFRAYRRREFKPNVRIMNNLKEMGFAEKDIIDALRITGNKEEEACEWLLGNNRPRPDEDLDTGLSPDGAIYKAIMSNPVVQLGLNNPRSLLAFLHMLENPNNTQQWVNDPDTGPMLIQISRIYHAEKHAPKSSTSST